MRHFPPLIPDEKINTERKHEYFKITVSTNTDSDTCPGYSNLYKYTSSSDYTEVFY